MSSEERDRLRALTVGKSEEPPSELVEIDDGAFIEVRGLIFEEALTIREGLTTIVPQDGLTKKEALKEGAFDIEVDTVELNLRYLLKCCYVPETGERLYEEADLDELRKKPGNKDHWINRLITTADQLNSAGNFERTPGD